MPDIFHFGDLPRTLLGVRHAPDAAARNAMLACAPLLQEGVRAQRALWSLSESLAAAGVEVLRFDWYGSGDSAGTSLDMDLAGLVADIAAAEAQLSSASGLRPRLLALRSAALPLLAAVAARRQPADVVLWAPVLDGAAMVSDWRDQHLRQMTTVGRFTRPVACDDDELLGFVVGPGLLAELGELRGRDLVLAAGSRLAIACWPGSPVDASFVDAQREAGVVVELIALDGADEPPWDDADQFETQLFPRRAVVQLAASLATPP